LTLRCDCLSPGLKIMSEEAETALHNIARPWLMVAEIEHRVVNEYTQAVAFLSASAMLSNSLEVKAVLNGAAEQLRSFASVHRALQAEFSNATTDLAQYLRRLCDAVSCAILARREINVTLIEREVELEATRCWRVGLIVFELIMNAARHAFAQDRGSISIEIMADEDRVLCSVSDDGKDFSDFVPGRGSHIIDAIADELGGYLTRQRDLRETTVLLSFPRHTRGARNHAHRLPSLAEGKARRSDTFSIGAHELCS
jgi:two-component sensor histidine kinase